MLRNNNSFDRVLQSVMIILKNSIENSESKRKEVTSKGNNYNIKKWDVCNKLFKNNDKCWYKKKINYSKKNIIINEYDENFIPECEVCRKNRIEDENKYENEYENFILNEIKEASEKINANKNNIEMNAFKFGSKEDNSPKISQPEDS